MLKRVIRRRPPVSLAISMLALFVALSGWGYAATGGSFLLGKGNSAGKTTSLSSRVKTGPSLSVTNRGGQPAASFNVNSGVPPFTVNSTAKVTNLNADLLDGLDSTQLQQQATGASWSLTGNAGTAPIANFLGTTDNEPLLVKTNNAEAMRVTADGNVGVGTTGPIAKLEARSTTGIGLLGTSTSRGVVGRLGADTPCPGTYGVGGCAGAISGLGVFGQSDAGTAIEGDSGSGTAVVATSSSGIGLLGTSSTRGVIGRLGGGTPCPGAYAIGGCTGANSGLGVFGQSDAGTAIEGDSLTGIGVVGNSAAQGTVGTLNGLGCPGAFGVGGCAAGADGVLGVSGVPANSFTGAAFRGWNTTGGDIFLGESGSARTRVARIDGNGKGFFDGGTQSSGADYAESIPAVDAASLKPGDVLAIDPARGFVVRKSSAAGSALVVGVYSTKPAVLAVGSHGVEASLAGEVPVAMVGIVPTKVTAVNGPIRAGDLLTTSDVPGYAMKARALVVRGVKIYPTGTILGKALQPLSSGTGVIQILLMLR